MSNDRAQELTAKINQSITALCAETDAAKQSETYLAWLSTVSRFYKFPSYVVLNIKTTMFTVELC